MVSDQCRWISIPAKSNRLFHQSHRPSDIQWCMIGDSNISFAMQRRNMVRPVSTHLLPSGNYIPCRVSQFLYTNNDPERGTLRSISRASGIITTKMRTTRCHLAGAVASWGLGRESHGFLRQRKLIGATPCLSADLHAAGADIRIMPRHVALRQSSAHKFDKAERTFLEYLPVGYINIRENSPLSWTGFFR